VSPEARAIAKWISYEMHGPPDFIEILQKLVARFRELTRSTPEARWLVCGRDIDAAIHSVGRDDYYDEMFSGVQDKAEQPPPYDARNDYDDTLRWSVRGRTDATARPYASRDDYRDAILKNVRGGAEQRFDPREDYENTIHKSVRSNVTAHDPFEQLNRAALLRRWWNMKRNCEGFINADITGFQNRLLLLGEPERPGAEPMWIPPSIARYHHWDPHRPDVLLLNGRPNFFNLQVVFREQWSALATQQAAETAGNNPAPPPAPPPKAQAKPPAFKRGLNEERDDLARKALRERKWGKKRGDYWVVTASQAKRLWGLADELADRCPVQEGSKTSHSTRQKAMRAALKRVTGS